MKRGANFSYKKFSDLNNEKNKNNFLSFANKINRRSEITAFDVEEFEDFIKKADFVEDDKK